MKCLKKNQIIIYTFALMLVTAGYLNYTNKVGEEAKETSSQETYVNEQEVADIGDAKLVNSNDVIEENSTNTNAISSNTNNINTNSSLTNQNSANTVNITESENGANSTNNINTVNQSVETSSNSTGDDYFVKSKLERDTMYSQMIESYEKILNSSNSSETRKTVSNTRDY